MRHIFASGEEIYHKNEKELDQGKITLKNIDYDVIDENTVFVAEGVYSERMVTLKFKIKSNSFDEIKFRYSVKILMLSDLVQAEWEYYEITYL